jgi:hypothetical protein
VEWVKACSVAFFWLSNLGSGSITPIYNIYDIPPRKYGSEMEE